MKAHTQINKAFFGWLTPQCKLFWLEFWQPLFPTLVRQKDKELATKIVCADHRLLLLIGLDGVTYLHFLRLLRWLFLGITLFAALPLALANYYLNTQTQEERMATHSVDTANVLQTTSEQDPSKIAQHFLDNMMLFTMANLSGDALWVHVGFEAMVTVLVIFFGGCIQAYSGVQLNSVVVYSWYYEHLVKMWIDL